MKQLKISLAVLCILGLVSMNSCKKSNVITDPVNPAPALDKIRGVWKTDSVDIKLYTLGQLVNSYLYKFSTTGTVDFFSDTHMAYSIENNTDSSSYNKFSDTQIEMPYPLTGSMDTASILLLTDSACEILYISRDTIWGQNTETQSKIYLYK